MVEWKRLQRILEDDISLLSQLLSKTIIIEYDFDKNFCDFSTPLVKTDLILFVSGLKSDIILTEDTLLSQKESFFFLKGENHDTNHLNLLFDKYENSSDPLIIELAIEQLSNYGQVTFAEINYENMIYEAYCEKQAWTETIEEFKTLYDGSDYEKFIIDCFNDMVFNNNIFSFINPEKLAENNIHISKITNLKQIDEYFDKYSQLNLNFKKDYDISKITSKRNDSIRQRCDEHTGGYELLENLAKINNPLEFNRELLALNLAIDDDPRFHQNVERGVNLKHDFYNNFKCIPTSEKQKIIDRANEICREIKKDYRLEDITPERDKQNVFDLDFGFNWIDNISSNTNCNKDKTPTKDEETKTIKEPEQDLLDR